MHEHESAEDTTDLQGDIDIRAVGSLVLVVALGICIALGYLALRGSLNGASDAQLMAAADSRVQSLEAWFATRRAQLAEQVVAFTTSASGATMDIEALARHVQATTGNPVMVVAGDGSLLAARVPPYSSALGAPSGSVLADCAAAGQSLIDFASCKPPGEEHVWIAVELQVAGEPLRFLTRAGTSELEAVFASGGGAAQGFLLGRATDGHVMLASNAPAPTVDLILAGSPAGTVVDGAAGSARTSDSGTAVVAVWLPVQSLPWGVVVTLDPSIAQEPARVFLMLGLLVLVVAVPATYLLLAALARTAR